MHALRFRWRASPATHCARCAGFTLIEIMVVVVILGLLATLVVPNVIDNADRAKATKTQTDVRAIHQAAKLFRVDNTRNPTLEDLTRRDAKGKCYLDDLRDDPWGHAYVVRDLDGGRFEVLSFGPDGMEGTEDDISSLPVAQR